MRAALATGALLALAACLYVPYRYSGAELATMVDGSNSITRPISGVIYAPIWNEPDEHDVAEHRTDSIVKSLPLTVGVSLDGTRVGLTLAVIGAVTVLAAVVAPKPKG